MFDWSSIVTYWYIFEWLLRITAIFIVPPNRKPTAGLSWLMFIFLVPLPGMLVFLVLGSSKLPPQRRKSQEVTNEYVVKVLEAVKKFHPDMTERIDGTVAPEHQATATLAQELTGLSVVGDTSVECLIDYAGSIERMVQDVQNAKELVYVEFFIMTFDDTTEPLFEAMKQAVNRGVVVRVLYDYWGSFKMPGYKQMLRHFKQDGVLYHPMLPLRLPGMGYVRPDLRNHRKLIVIDDTIGYTGSLNMVERAYHRKDTIVYDELMIRVKGLVVLQLKSVFLADWYSETGDMLTESYIDLEDIRSREDGTMKAQVVPSGPGYQFENNLKIFIQLFYGAKESIVIVNPYFVPEESLITALITAAQRGVRVTLVNSEAIDQIFVAHAQSSYYQQMLDAGVKIYHYKAPALLHSKYFIVDDVAIVGSSNVDIRSFQLNHELIVILYDKIVVMQLRGITEQYLKKSKRLSLGRWAKRSAKSRLLDNIARLTSALQ